MIFLFIIWEILIIIDVISTEIAIGKFNLHEGNPLIKNRLIRHIASVYKIGIPIIFILIFEMVNSTCQFIMFLLSIIMIPLFTFGCVNNLHKILKIWRMRRFFNKTIEKTKKKYNLKI